MRPLLAAFLLLAVACALPSATTAAERGGCYPRDSITVRENRQARLFVVKRDGFWHSYYGCLFRDGRPRALRENPYEKMTGHKLAGRFVAYRWEEQTTTLTVTRLTRLSIRSGRTTALDVVSTSDADGKVGTIRGFLATRSGAAVWVRAQYERGTDVRELRKFDRGGVATLATGDRFHSVRLSDDQRRVLWFDGEAERSARLR